MEKNDAIVQNEPKSKSQALLEVLAVSTKLGLTSFGGPTLILVIFTTNTYAAANGWMNEAMRIWSRCVSFCPVRPAVRLGLESVLFAPDCSAG